MRTRLRLIWPTNWSTRRLFGRRHWRRFAAALLCMYFFALSGLLRIKAKITRRLCVLSNRLPVVVTVSKPVLLFSADRLRQAATLRKRAHREMHRKMRPIPRSARHRSHFAGEPAFATRRIYGAHLWDASRGALRISPAKCRCVRASRGRIGILRYLSVHSA